MLPDVSGNEICKKIRQRNSLKSIPIIYITSISEEEVSEIVQKTEANGYIIKPFDISQIKKLFDYLG
ncbi:MAG: PleD family two-component system response regulator [Promethearchaeota archaeon]